jgi:hypothetical protein
MVAGGVISHDAVAQWTAGSEVMLDSDLEIDGSLTIEPGTRVVASDGVGIVVKAGGLLSIDGTAGEPVELTTDGSDVWRGIDVESGGELVVTHATIEKLAGFGVRSADAAVSIEDGVIDQVFPGADGSATGLSLSGGDVRVARTVVSRVEGADGAAGASGAAGDAGLDGADGAATPPEDGGDGADGAPGAPGEDGGSATGIHIGPATVAELQGNRIEDIAGGDAGPGGSGGDGGAGGHGGGGDALQSGGNGGSGGAGGDGAFGGDGGDARGLWIESADSVSLVDQILRGISAGVGGDGGAGGAGGSAGSGGDGGAQSADPDLPGAGGIGGMGGDGGSGGDAGAGGFAWGIDAQDSITDGIVQHLVARVSAGAPGMAGPAGAGGDGGAGGAGGDSVTAAIDGAAGGDGGAAGAAGDGGAGGSAGMTSGIEVANAPASELASLDTIAELSAEPGTAGAPGGLAGMAGLGGPGGAGLAPADGNMGGAQGTDGAAAADGMAGPDGADGGVGGIVASLGSDLVVRDSILALGNPTTAVGLDASDGSIDTDFNFFDGVAALYAGSVSGGTRDREEDPRFIDVTGDDFRIGPDSTAIDAGDNDYLPAGITTDLAGEPRPVDDPATPDTGEGRGDDRVVDVGAYEFQPPRCDTDPASLWPPNHDMVAVALDVDLGTSAALDPAVGVLASSDEPDNDIGDGNTTGDVNGFDGFTSPVDVTAEIDAAGEERSGEIDLRRERAGPGDGRLYTILVTLSGDFATRETTCFVEVPHDQGG